MKKIRCSSNRFGFGYKAISRFLLLFSILVLFVASVSSVMAATIEVSQPTALTVNNEYDRNPSIIKDETNYWLFYTKGDDTTTDGVRGGDYNPDGDNYVVYYKTASTIDGLASAAETQLVLSQSARPANFDQRVVSAAVIGSDIYAFVSSGQSGTDRGLYYYVYDGSWAGPTTLIADTGAPNRGGHVNVVSDETTAYIVWESSDGSSDFYTFDGTTLSSKVDISTDNQPKITLMGTTLYVVSVEDTSGDIEVHSATAGASPSFSSHSTAIPGAGLYDPVIFNDGTDLYVVTAPWVAVDRQYLIQAKYSDEAWSPSAKQVSYGGYDGVEWWDYWPIGYHDGADAYVFFTTETSSPTYSDGEIAYIKIDWTLTNDHYFYIQNAIDQASSGDTINVAAGTYDESGQIVIDKDLTITGASKTTTIIKPTADTGSSGDARGWFLVNDGIKFYLSDLTLDGSGYKVWQGIRHKGSGTVSDCIIKNIKYEESGQSYAGTAVAVFGSPEMNVDITNSIFSEIGRVGVLYFGTGVTESTFSGNTYTGKGDGDWLDYGVEVGSGAKAIISNNEISDCTGVASSDGSTSAGILVTTYYGEGTTAEIQDNILYDNTEGIAVGYDEFDTSTVVVNNGNEIYNNEKGIGTSNSTSISLTVNNNKIYSNSEKEIDATDGPSVDAEENWWGTTTGIDSLVSSNVDYSPWLGATVGTSPMTWYTDDSIQDVIDAASSGDTINVAAGTYEEIITIDKSLTLRGATYDVNKNGYAVPEGYAWDDESVIQNPSSEPIGTVVKITSDDVTVEGFVIQSLDRITNNYGNLIEIQADGHGKDLENIDIINNVIGPNTNTVDQDGSKGRMNLYIAINQYQETPWGLTNSLISGNKIFGSEGNGNAVFIWGAYYNYSARNPSPMTGTIIEDNEICCGHRSGIETAGGISGLIIRNNDIHNFSSLTTDSNPDLLKYGSGILLIRGSGDRSTCNGFGPEDLTIEGNEIYDNEKNAIYMGPKNNGVTITDNDIHNNGWDAIRVDLIGNYWNPDFETSPGPYTCLGGSSDVSSQLNKIYDNNKGIQVIGTPSNGFELDAEKNYWGAVNPDFDNIISENVEYYPWYLDSGLTQLSGQPTCTPDDTETESCGTDVGECVAGTRTRSCTSSGNWGSWSECEGTYFGPIEEVCDDGKDNDCDGYTDTFDSDCSETPDYFTASQLQSATESSGASLIGYFADWISSTVQDALDWLYENTLQLTTTFSAVLGSDATVSGEYDALDIQLKAESVGSNEIEDNAVTQGKIASHAVTYGKIATGAVVTDKIEDGAVTDAKINDVDWNKLINVPTGLEDGDDNTQLTETEVDTYVSNNGYAADADLETETNARTEADTTLQNNIVSEQLRAELAEGLLDGRVNTLEEKALENTNGLDIYLTQGWNKFKLPWFVLTGTEQVNGLDVEDYLVATVLAGIDTKYSYLAYYDGTEWQTYVPGEEAATSFTEFPTDATQEDFDFHIYMNEGARLTIGLSEEEI